MKFTRNDKLKALAIVHVFETSRPFGDFAALVVLDDGAGVSYGINQFTHRSGSLRAVVERYLSAGGQAGREILSATMPALRSKSAAAINRLAADAGFKRALRLAASTHQMRDAQTAVGFEKYLLPALAICERHDFELPLSLAVVYDSVTHGSWQLIAGRVAGGAAKSFFSSVYRAADPLQKRRFVERAWVTEYVRRRRAWLTGVGRLRKTNYRTKFFLNQIAIGNWHLRLPVTVHGVRLTDAMFQPEREPEQLLLQFDPPLAPITPADGHIPADAATHAGEVATAIVPENGTAVSGDPTPAHDLSAASAFPSVLESAGNALSSAADKFDRVDVVVNKVATRKDAAKSLWTTIIGTIWQAVWGVFGFFIGLPRGVWIVVAVIGATLAVIFLYRQIVLGRMREISNRKSEI